MKSNDVQKIILEHNKVFGQAIRQERQKRKLSLDKLASGILSRTTLEKVEKGKTQWTKLTGDTLMLRMGMLPEYFESLSSSEELSRWRLREDICLLMPDKPKAAEAKLKEYREKYESREPLEEQFLLKAEVVLMLTHTKEQATAILDKARDAADCTIYGNWEQHLAEHWLSPGELEAVLLVSAALFLNGEADRAWALWQSVWEYPKTHNWPERARALILPQAAVLGIRQAHASGEPANPTAMSKLPMKNMISSGQEALELLRRNGCHCHVLPLLDALCDSKAALFQVPDYLDQIQRFQEMFRTIYKWFAYPGYRIWQGISVDNTRDVGIVLKMLRKFYGISRENAVFDGTEPIVTPRQLEKIEKGIHKPSYENYDRLVKQYGKNGGWNMPLLETDSAETLALRQRISTLLEHSEWEHAEWEICRFRNMVNPACPRIKQELLFFDAVLKWKKEGALQESLETMLEALHCTVPDFEGRDMGWWVYQREETIIASNIGSLYRRLGNMDTAKKWFEAVLFSLQQNSARTGIYNYGYDVVAEGYDNFLGDVSCFDRAVEFSGDTVSKNLLCFRINGIQRLFYHIAWNVHAAAAGKPEEYGLFRQKWKKAFQISQALADFMLDAHLKDFLEKQRAEYLS